MNADFQDKKMNAEERIQNPIFFLLNSLAFVSFSAAICANLRPN